jgi:hypothetical protein
MKELLLLVFGGLIGGILLFFRGKPGGNVGAVKETYDVSQKAFEVKAKELDQKIEEVKAQEIVVETRKEDTTDQEKIDLWEKRKNDKV